ncbi:MAG: hypothetical protein JSS24_02335, partial [Proteobacteria bacterium]|nr:hypothetical protein [Pseudomonadota bacterium]
TASTPANDAQIPGCVVADDFTHALGDAGEARLAAALGYQTGAGCPVAPIGLGKLSNGVNLAAAHGHRMRSPLYENLILGHAPKAHRGT